MIEKVAECDHSSTTVNNPCDMGSANKLNQEFSPIHKSKFQQHPRKCQCKEAYNNENMGNTLTSCKPSDVDFFTWVLGMSLFPSHGMDRPW